MIELYRKLGLREKIAMTLSGLMIIALSGATIGSYQQSQNITMEVEHAKLEVIAKQIESELEGHRNNLLTLRGVPPIEAIARALKNRDIDPQSGDHLDEWRNRLNQIFASFLQNHSQYFQIRYLNRNGDELVRVERDSRGFVQVARLLQNKSEYPYVSETLKLAPGQIYHSDVTLNREHGTIQKPYTPVLRLATPISDKSREIIGLLVINLSTEKLFNNVHDEDNGIRRSLTDQKGNFLKHSDKSKILTHELGANYSLLDIEPDLHQLSRQKEAFMRMHGAHDEMDGFRKIYFSPHEEDRYWLLIQNIPDHIVFSRVASMLEKMVLITFLMGLISLLLIYWFLSRQVIAPIRRLYETTSALRAGDLSVRVDEQDSISEFRALSAAINAFADQQEFATEKLENEVALQTEKLSAVINHVVDAIITISEDGTIESFNPAATDIFGYNGSEVIGKNVNILMPEPYRSEHDNYLKQHRISDINKIIGIGREVTGLRKDGTTFPIDLAVSALRINDKKHYVGIIRDITERKQSEEKIRKMAHFDHLTSLPNRALFNDRLSQAITAADRNSETIALLFIDLDGFKAINDGMGHDAGDKLLRQVALRLKASVREVDTVARLGGDEFAVILVNVKSPDNAVDKATLIIESISTPYPEIGHGCAIGCSIGIAFYPQDATNRKELLTRADSAMYSVKKSGKNNYSFYQKETDSES